MENIANKKRGDNTVEGLRKAMGQEPVPEVPICGSLDAGAHLLVTTSENSHDNSGLSDLVYSVIFV